MFFIMGIDPRTKRLLCKEDLFVCNGCGKYGRYEVWVTYMCFSLFFIPLFKWGKRYYVKTTCCETVYELDAEQGRMLEKGQEIDLRQENMTVFAVGRKNRYCRYCGFSTEEDFQYCPKCGASFE